MLCPYIITTEFLNYYLIKISIFDCKSPISLTLLDSIDDTNQSFIWWGYK